MKPVTKMLSVGLLAFTLLGPLAGTALAASVVKARNNNTFSPTTLTVSKGTKVIWKNPTSKNHNVTATSSNWSKSSMISPGNRTTFKFQKKGTFSYTCTLHGGMSGKIVVKA